MHDRMLLDFEIVVCGKIKYEHVRGRVETHFRHPGECHPARLRQFAVVFYAVGRRESGNDPSAGSPTETLLRLLLPLNDQV